MPRSSLLLAEPGATSEPIIQRLLREGWGLRMLRDFSPSTRNAALREGVRDRFTDFLFLADGILAAPDAVMAMAQLDAPLVCALTPLVGKPGFAGGFLPETRIVHFGRDGGPLPLNWAWLGLARIRREVLESLGSQEWFAPQPGVTSSPDEVFCRRAQAAGYPIVADTRVRVTRFGPSAFSWEEASRVVERHDRFVLHLEPPPLTPLPPLREPARPLTPEFPRLQAYVVTYPANRSCCAATLESLARSDWPVPVVVVEQPGDVPPGREAGLRNYRRAIARALADEVDFALILEDDVRVNRHLHQHLRVHPLVRRDQCDFLGLFLPDLIADPWERHETDLGYRVARPRFVGPNVGWERARLWGSQALLLSRQFLQALDQDWDALGGFQDARVLGTCARHGVVPFYTSPCLVEHAPMQSRYDTPLAYAPDYDPDLLPIAGKGFQPPESIPGWLTLDEARLLARIGVGRTVLELGTRAGRSTVCLAQTARQVTSVDIADQSEAQEWVRRYGLADRVTFHQGDVGVVGPTLPGGYDLVFIDTGHDEVSVRRDIDIALALAKPGVVLAFHDYPDPGWPDVRRVVDKYAARRGWKRIAQAGFLGVFATSQ